MNVLITGSEGFIGKELCKKIENKHSIWIVDRKIGIEVLDISEETLYNIDCVIHLAAQTSVWNENIKQIEHDNIKSFIHIFELCKKLNIKFIYASSSCSINVTSMYGLSKKFNDDYVKLYNYGNCVGLRFHNVYGPNSRDNTLMGICLNNDNIKLYNNGLNFRHFTYIDDILNCIEYVIENKTDYHLYNIVNPEENSILDFTYEIFKYKKMNITKTSEIRQYDKSIQQIDINTPNLIEVCNIKPTSYKEGIKRVFESLR